MHIPFCVVKCGYCDFHSLAGVPDDQVATVLDAMLAELRAKWQGGPAYTVFFGGGTPTHVATPLLARFLRGFDEIVPLPECREVSCEANPESLDDEKLELLQRCGVRRLSVGVQSFDAGRLRFLDRPHDVQGAEEALRRAQASAAFDLSLDLIYGIPGQSLSAWERELEQALSFATGHLSAYHLSFEQGTALHARRERGEVQELADEEQRSFFEWTRGHCAASGLAPYEISNFARPGKECLHNLHYWAAGEYLGIGPGAAEHRAGRRSRNWKSLPRYVQEIATHGRADCEVEQLEPEQRLREAIWLGLRRQWGVDLDELRERFQVQPELAAILDRCRAMAWIEEDGSRIRIADTAWSYADGIAQLFL